MNTYHIKKAKDEFSKILNKTQTEKEKRLFNKLHPDNFCGPEKKKRSEIKNRKNKKIEYIEIPNPCDLKFDP